MGKAPELDLAVATSATTPSPGRLGDKVHFVTGSSSGIGRAIKIAYMCEGAKVVCADITHGQEGGEDRSIFIEADMSGREDVQALVKKAVQRFGRLDIIVKNLENDWDRTMAINARSVFLGSKYVIVQMSKQEPHSSEDRGWIINRASVGGLSASKGALIQTTK
ncbi:hypothetical protein BDR22DRAFT_878570 [Usnea florida]